MCIWDTAIEDRIGVSISAGKFRGNYTDFGVNIQVILEVIGLDVLGQEKKRYIA